MGMDVYGKNPTTEEGKYFRSNVWTWRPLWDYCCLVGKDIIPEDVRLGGRMNDGAGLDAEDSQKLAVRLKGAIVETHTSRYEKSYREDIAALPMKQCWLCAGTGVRTDGLVCSDGCNACYGKGVLADSKADYPFYEENVKDFAIFLEGCGGFEIC